VRDEQIDREFFVVKRARMDRMPADPVFNSSAPASRACDEAKQFDQKMGIARAIPRKRRRMSHCAQGIQSAFVPAGSRQLNSGAGGSRPMSGSAARQKSIEADDLWPLATYQEMLFIK
jgi:hypothetical protein